MATDPYNERRMGGGAVAGIVLVSIWMAISLLFTFLLGAGETHVCGSDTTCLDRYRMWWAVLLIGVAVSALATIILWIFPKTRPWGFVVGVLGTGGAAVAFTILYGVPL